MRTIVKEIDAMPISARRVRLEATGRPGAIPILELIPGPHPYIWIGDDDGECYATCEPEDLKTLVETIHKLLHDPT